MQWNLEWIRTFKSIYETGTLSGAAKVLFISQPGVSLHLNSLEAYVGYKLFDRSPRRMIPTEKGKILYNCIAGPLEKLETVEQHFHKRSQQQRVTISVGMCFETFQYTLEEHIAELPFNLILKFGLYPQMQSDLDNGLLDMIVTPQKGNQKNLLYEPFSKERIILVAGSKTDTLELTSLIEKGDNSKIQYLLKQQLWYGTAGDMDHLKNFWLRNFNKHPDFSPNYIVSNISSIIRCLSYNKGLAVVPDFLCRQALSTGAINLIWKGSEPWENTLYFGTRKKTIYQKELQQLQNLFKQKWEPEILP